MNKSDENLIHTLRELIDETYVVYKLKEFHKHFLQDFIKKNKRLCADYGISKLSNKAKKPELVDLFAVFFAHKELFMGMLETLPAHVQALMQKAIWGDGFHQNVIESKYEVEITKPFNKRKYVSQDYMELKPEYYLFNDQSEHRGWNSWRDSSNKESTYVHLLYMDDELSLHLRAFFAKPEGYYIKPLDTIEETAYQFDAEPFIFQELPVVNAYIQQERLAVTKTGIITDAALNKMRKFCNIQEFFTDTSDKGVINYRTRCLAIAALGWDKAYTRKDIPLIDVIRKILEEFAVGKIGSESFLYHLKGWHNISSSSVQANESFMYVLNDLPEQWVDVSTLRAYVIYRGLDFDFFHYQHEMNYVHLPVKYSKGGYSYTDKIKINPANYGTLLTYPYLRNCMAFFASLGILEIAYNLPSTLKGVIRNRNVIVPGDDIKYIRLTALGAFVLGKNTKYTPPEVKEDRVILDKDNLLLLYQGENKSLVSMIESIAINVSKNLYKVSFETVLGNCNSAKEVATQISVFKQLLSKNPPEIWQEFFSALQQKSYQLKNKNEEYFIYKLPDNPELVRLIAKDEFLRKHIIRAEYHNILVPHQHKNKIKKYLKKSGFLIEFD